MSSGYDWPILDGLEKIDKTSSVRSAFLRQPELLADFYRISAMGSAIKNAGISGEMPA